MRKSGHSRSTSGPLSGAPFPGEARPAGQRYAPAEPRAFYPLSVRPVRGPEDRGLFTDRPIRAQAVIGVDGGRVLTSLAGVPAHPRLCVLLGEGLYLAPADPLRRDLFSYLNHSCSANVSRVGGLVFVARRGIAAGEELTLDYAPLVAGLPGWRMACACGEPGCRKEVTGDDWRDPALARALWGEWLPHTQQEIVRLGILQEENEHRTLNIER